MVYACPQSPADVGDDREARLVILSPEWEHLANKGDSPAIEAAKKILESRGTGPRLCRNTLMFIAADRTRLSELEDSVRWWLAWNAIDDKKDDLDLNQSQIRTVEKKLKEWSGVVEQRIPETYRWLLVPGQSSPTGEVEWLVRPLNGQDWLAVRAAKKLTGEELLFTSFGGVRLRMELDRVPLWRGDDVPVKQLSSDFAQYLYLPRLTSPTVLIEAITDGVNLLTWRRDAFAYAESKEADGRYLGLRCGENVRPVMDGSAVLVKSEVASAQRDADVRARGESPSAGGKPGVLSGEVRTAAVGSADASEKATAAPPTRFYGSVSLDPRRLGRDAGKIAEEVIAHLVALSGAEVRLTLDIEVDVLLGVDPPTVRTVTENCRTLNFKTHGFETG